MEDARAIFSFSQWFSILTTIGGAGISMTVFAFMTFQTKAEASREREAYAEVIEELRILRGDIKQLMLLLREERK